MNNVITSRVAIGWIVDTLQKIRRASSTFLKQPVFVFIASFILCFHFFSCTNAQKKFDDLMTKGKVQFNKADHFSRSAEDTVSTWEGGFTKAIQYLEEAVKLNPNDAEAHYYLGHAYDRFYCTISPGTNIPNIRLDEVKKISEQFQRVIELRTNYSTPLVNVGPRSKLTGIWGSLAMAYITRGEIDSAKWAFMQGQKAGGFPQAILEYCRNILTCCEQNAILFVSGDNDTFPMLFLQIAEGFRTDVNVLNHPLLNTSWYLKFNHHGIASVFNTVKMSFTDNELENLELKVYKENVYSLHVPQKFFRQYGITDKLIIQKGQMSWLLKPTFEDACGTSALYPHDIVILDIIKSNEWVRPIYFSTALEHKNFLILDEYLRLEG